MSLDTGWFDRVVGRGTGRRLAGRIMKGGYGLIGDLVLGIVGAYFGGFIFTLVFPDGGTYASSAASLLR